MLTKTKVAVAATLFLSTASIAVAQYDGDENPIPGARQRGVVINQAPSAFGNTFAATRPTRRTQRRQFDGDENRVPGSR
jgi:hypothetical protein